MDGLQLWENYPGGHRKYDSEVWGKKSIEQWYVRPWLWAFPVSLKMEADTQRSRGKREIKYSPGAHKHPPSIQTFKSSFRLCYLTSLPVFHLAISLELLCVCGLHMCEHVCRCTVGALLSVCTSTQLIIFNVLKDYFLLCFVLHKYVQRFCLWARVTNTWHGGCESSSSPLKEQNILLTAGPSL